ncbi:MAG: TetR/AcrR family transcriptional regulator [Longimicrobiales bacterium]
MLLTESAKGAATRAHILEEAAAEASLVGLTGLTIGRLAARTGMSKSGLFRHFGSKEQLQVQTLTLGVERFKDVVVRPALKEPRGPGRIVTLFEGWLSWATGKGFPGGCLFVTASVEMDDQPGPVRDYVEQTQRDWLELIGRAAGHAVEAESFRSALDTEQVAHEFNSLLLAFQQADRLLRDPKAADRAQAQFNRLIGDARS